jgi:hypothetical protein
VRRRAFAAALLVGAGTAALLPQVAAAHGLVGRADLPIPTYLFTYGAAIVLFVSFLGLAVLWPEPRLQEPVEKPWFRMPRWVDPACGAIGVAVFVLVVVSGMAGTKTATDNFADTFIYVLFWVGLVIVSVLLGDVFRAFNPWRAVARFAAWAGFAFRQPRGGPVPYPVWLGRWPAALGILGFAWLELAYANKTDPELLALLAVGYAGVQLAAMAFYGIEPWCEKGDAFGVYFNLFSRISAFRRRDDRMVVRRRLLSGLPQLDIAPGTTVLVCVMIGSTSFDGFSSTSTWTSISPHLESFFSDVGAGRTLATELTSTVGLAALVGLVGGFYRLGILGVHSVGGGFSTRELARQFAHTLVPIAMAYVIAHYFSLLVFQGQATYSLISDPLGKGSDFFGTANRQIDYNVVSGAAIWYVQVGALIVGHVAGLILAHDRALALYDSSRRATRSQYWMLLIMIGFTSFALWLLASLNG